MIQCIDNVFHIPTATLGKKNQKYSNNTESFTLEVDGPITGRAYIPAGGGLITGIFFLFTG